MVIAIALFLFFLSLLFAFVEIEIEGKNGWGEKIPTWYRKRKGIRNLSRPLTGYHLTMHLFVLLFFHIGFFIGLAFNWVNEIYVLALYLMFFVIEDFLWFVFNPYYGLRKFKKDKIWWHSKTPWVFGIFPIDYVYGVVIGSILMGISAYHVKDVGMFYDWVKTLGIILVLVFLSFLFAGVYRKSYWGLRKEDDRKKTEIFHRK